LNILTFDIEEWFHILDNDSTKTESEWSNYESRIHRNMDRIFSMLDESDQKATFFCLGWIADRYPEVIRKIDSLGYEVASHSHMHQLVYEQKPADYRRDLERSIKSIEDITGKKVISYRSPGFSLTEKCTWAFDILAELGIETDCSVFPAPRAHGGFASIDIQEPFLLKKNGYTLQEFPMSTFNYSGVKLAFSGGGYFRLLPYTLIRKMMKKEPYVMTYFHPRDFDKGQPKIKELSLFRQFKSYYGLARSSGKLQKMLKEFKFTDLNEARKTIDWKQTKVVSL